VHHESHRNGVIAVGLAILALWFGREVCAAPPPISPLEQLMALTGVLDRGPASSERLLASDALIQLAQERLSSGAALSEFWVPAYERHFTPDDVRALNGFFGTPLGRRWVAAWPAIQQECLLAAASLGKDAAKRAIREVLGPLPQWRLLHPLPPSD
jgi:hypothetical protein